MQSQIIIRKAGAGDADAIAVIHKLAFQGFFLDRMGIGFLIAYYSVVMEYERNIIFVAENSAGELVGFVAGFLNKTQFYRFVFTRSSLFFLPVLSALLKNPSLILEVTLNIFRIKRVSLKRGAESEISSIGVSKKGMGIGSQLLCRFIAEVKSSGSKVLTLTTDHQHNIGAKNFYEKHGFRVVGVQVRLTGRVLTEYSLDFTYV